MRLWCAVPTPEKVIVQLLTVVIRQASPAQNMFVYVSTCEAGVFRRGLGHFWRVFDREGGIAHQPVLVSENQSDSFRVVSKYLQFII